MRELAGWLLDLYPNPGGGITLWLLGEDGRRYPLRQEFPVTFYAAGRTERLRELWKFLQAQSFPVKLSRAERRDLFSGMTTVLAIEVSRPADQPLLFAQVARAFPELTFYDADLHITLRHAAVHHTYPLARLKAEVDEQNQIHSLCVLSTPLDLDEPVPPLRMLALEPDVDPAHAQPARLIVRTPRSQYALDLSDPQAVLFDLKFTLERHDPDLLLTGWGDTWLLPRLLQLSENSPLPFNRDSEQGILHKPARSYFAYGQVIYRGAQVHLFGRYHIDIYNAVMYHDYGLDGIWELARMTSLPVQTVARVSPGTGISSMQIVTAIRQGILVPWHKQQAESPKSASDLLLADQGGLVYQPTIGLHQDVAEVDFISMYPSIMEHFNISPETVIPGRHEPGSGLPVTRAERGLVPDTLAPLLKKRIELKMQLAGMSHWDERYKRYKAFASAHKWLLVTCFGYLGYKNARFGRIEAHEAVTAYGREALLRAKEAAERLGFTVLHLYVDGMWVQKDGCSRVQDFSLLLEEILESTGLPIALDGIYKWVAFLPSRQDARVPVPNRYFGVFQSGEIKVRGIELRRRDTPAFIKEAQTRVLDILARSASARGLRDRLPAVRDLVHEILSDMRAGRIPLENLLVGQCLSRELAEYRSPSPVAIAVRQLEAVGKHTRPGQYVRFWYTRGEPGIHAWNLPDLPDRRSLDLVRYRELLLRAVHSILVPLGLTRKKWDEYLSGSGFSIPLPVASGVFMDRESLPALWAD